MHGKVLAFATLVACLLISFQELEAQSKPIRVFILAGQSNMEGHAKIETFDYIGDDPATAPLLKMMRRKDGKPTVCDGVSISYLTGDGEENFEVAGKLTAGYGSLGDNLAANSGARLVQSSPSV